jgi:hypothetical protein
LADHEFVPGYLEGTIDEIEEGKRLVGAAMEALEPIVGERFGCMVLLTENRPDEPGARVMYGASGIGRGDLVQLMLGWVARNARPEDYDRWDRDHPHQRG